MVVCAVRDEPVSIENSLFSGNFTGKFAISGGMHLERIQNQPFYQIVAGEFPMKANREFFELNSDFRSRNRESSMPDRESRPKHFAGPLTCLGWISRKIMLEKMRIF
jgi:hypothetical protein